MKNTIILLIVLALVAFGSIYFYLWNKNRFDVLCILSKSETLILTESLIEGADDLRGTYCSVPREFAIKHSSRMSILNRGNFYWSIGVRPMLVENEKTVRFVLLPEDGSYFSCIFVVPHGYLMETPPYDFEKCHDVGIDNLSSPD